MADQRLQLSLSKVRLTEFSGKVFDEDAKPGVMAVAFSMRFESEDQGVSHESPGILMLSMNVEGRAGDSPVQGSPDDGSKGKAFEVHATMTATFLTKPGTAISSSEFGELYDETVPLLYPYLREHVQAALDRMGVKSSLPLTAPSKSAATKSE